MKTSTLKISAIALIACMALFSCKKKGCTDPVATNYNSNAEKDNGTCTYSTENNGVTLTITDNVTTPTTWSGNINICDDINISSALTISAGTQITMCAGTSIQVLSTGSLTAIGTAVSPISISGETSSPGYWEGISIESNNPNNTMDYVTIADAGSYWAWKYSNIYVSNQGKLGLTNSTVSNSERYGIYMEESSSLTAFANNTFSNSTNSGVNITAKQVGELDELTNYNLNNGENFITVRDATISTNQTWKKTTTPYLFIGSSEVTAALTIEPGVRIQFETDGGLSIEPTGSISAVGTSAEKITFEGKFASAGYWRAIEIESNNPNNKLEHVIIKDGGQYWAQDFCSLNMIVNGRVEMDNCSISNSNSWGMYVGQSCTVVSNGAVQTDATGVLVTNSLTGNGTGADANCVGGGCTVYFD